MARALGLFVMADPPPGGLPRRPGPVTRQSANNAVCAVLRDGLNLPTLPTDPTATNRATLHSFSVSTMTIDGTNAADV